MNGPQRLTSEQEDDIVFDVFTGKAFVLLAGERLPLWIGEPVCPACLPLPAAPEEQP